MTFRRALVSALRPALLVGPMLGVGTFWAIMAVALLFSESDSGMVMVALYGSVFALLAGLLIATPVCFVAVAALLLLAARKPAWMKMWRWIVAGISLGLLLCLPFLSLLAEPDDTFVSNLIQLAVFGMVGGIGAWLCRRIVAERLSELERAVDADVFG